MAEKKNILTYAGLKQYEDELQNLKVYRRKEVAQKIKEAREQGDLSENAELEITDLLEEEMAKDEVVEETVVQEKDEAPRKISDTELFDMIDSMYQKGDK